MNLQPLHNYILFRFVDDTSNDSLVSKTESGILMTKNLDYNEQRDARWAKVIAVGPEVMDETININEYILIEPLQWTVGVDFGDGTLWRTDESKVMCTSKEMLYRY